jgi:hypothetical protein
MEPIPLASLLDSAVDPAQYKLHCAVYNGEHHPIDVLSNDPHEWEGWNSWRSTNNDFNRQFILMADRRACLARRDLTAADPDASPALVSRGCAPPAGWEE